MVRRVETDLETLQRLGRARDFIDHCYDHPLSLDQISEKACFSRYHFLRLFRQAFNKTPHQYLIERRIEKAKELLGDDGLRVTMSVSKSAFRVSDPSALSSTRLSAKLLSPTAKESKRSDKYPAVSWSCTTSFSFCHGFTRISFTD